MAGTHAGIALNMEFQPQREQQQQQLGGKAVIQDVYSLTTAGDTPALI